jgi:hypothetical protein
MIHSDLDSSLLEGVGVRECGAYTELNIRWMELNQGMVALVVSSGEMA